MRILVATGGASHAVLALTFAAHLARLNHAALTVLAVVKQERERAAADRILGNARFILDPYLERDRYTLRFRVGHPAEEILREAESGGYQLVVAGEKQPPGPLSRFGQGSTALRLVEYAPCPVVVVKGQVGPVERVLICDSGIEARENLVARVTRQLPALLEHAREIVVLHVMSQMGAGPGVDDHLLRADAEQLIAERTVEGALLDRDVAVLEAAGYDTAPKVRHGLVVNEILTEARDGVYDLVVIGTHHGQGWRRILLDDISHQLVVGLDRPVLVVR